MTRWRSESFLPSLEIAGEGEERLLRSVDFQEGGRAIGEKDVEDVEELRVFDQLCILLSSLLDGQSVDCPSIAGLCS